MKDWTGNKNSIFKTLGASNVLITASIQSGSKFFPLFEHKLNELNK